MSYSSILVSCNELRGGYSCMVVSTSMLHVYVPPMLWNIIGRLAAATYHNILEAASRYSD